MPRAVSMIRDAPHYRADAIRDGLAANGFSVRGTSVDDPRPGDVLVVWNRYGVYDAEARKFAKAGATVIVAENGIVGARDNEHGKPVDAAGEPLYQLALSHVNGAGRWPFGKPGRWRAQGIKVEPWRMTGEHVLVLGQRGIGCPEVAAPKHWTDWSIGRLRSLTRRSVRVRGHPGNEPPKVPLAHDLERCWAVVTWNSAAGIRAICAGVPCFHEYKQWVGAPASLPLGLDIEKPVRDEVAREQMLDRLAWLQWTVREIASGAPFTALLELAGERAAA